MMSEVVIWFWLVTSSSWWTYPFNFPVVSWNKFHVCSVFLVCFIWNKEVGLSTDIGTVFSFEREWPFLLATSHSFLPALVQIYLSATYNQGSPNRWEPVLFDRLPVKPVRPGYRSNRSGPVPVWAGTKPAQIQNSNLNSKKKKNSQKKFLKILQGATNLMVSNFLKNSFV